GGRDDGRRQNHGNKQNDNEDVTHSWLSLPGKTVIPDRDSFTGRIPKPNSTLAYRGIAEVADGFGIH
ncbi:MAG TPA: hypothetical protein VHZ25_02575, partial [Acidobacteriaceae bacterium]|nr:hypothetical protein [Acidobacteriaceae bacterium]